ncbi:MAG: class I SAM-dependent methyltransferase [Verrucomicrobiaceae bacterium]|jgi:23S rRNA (cytosine1962-C5)-methyltransferase|nr:class I SAM-dependent methyltransferase [Verrucomicrobiaceae bacterium]
MEENQPTTQPDDAYELLDSGGGRVLERLGTVTGVRSHPQAWWRRRLGGAEWKKALDLKRDLQQPLKVRFGALTLLVGGAGGSLRALGPELAESWQQTTAACMAFTTKHRRPARVLHLFGGAGGHTLAASLGGAAVAHVDASGESLARARENAAAQPQAGRDIRWVLDDPVKFAQRERTQSQRHDLIILDPPTAPRDGKRGFDLERDLPPLLGTVSALLSDTACGVMLVCRQPGVSPTALLHLMRHDLSIFGGRFEHGELLLGGAAHPSAVPCGAFCHWWKA